MSKICDTFTVCRHCGYKGEIRVKEVRGFNLCYGYCTHCRYPTLESSHPQGAQEEWDKEQNKNPMENTHWLSLKHGGNYKPEGVVYKLLERLEALEKRVAELEKENLNADNY